MRIRPIWPLWTIVLLAADFVAAQEPLDVSQNYQEIVADFERIAATRNPAAIDSAGRLARHAYQALIDRAAGAADLNADDLFALGQCHEALGQRDEAKARYAESLASSPQARTHVALVRVNLLDDLPAAEQHFAEAVKLDSKYPGLEEVHLFLAAAYQRGRDWAGAAAHLERYLAFTKSLAEESPADAALRARVDAVTARLDKLRLFAAMKSKAAPALKVEHVIQGEGGDLESLKGKVVLLDFWAMWAAPSRRRMELLKQLHAKHGDKGLAIVGVTPAYKHRWSADTDAVTYDAELSQDEEIAGLAAFAKHHEIPWPLGLAERSLLDVYGVGTLPHTVVIDKQGDVSTILLGGKENDDALEPLVTRLLAE